MTMSNSNNVGNGNNQFGDTMLTKVFVGGLAWETPMEILKDHFDKYGEILEAVVISDKVTGRSKGYGFVTFKDPEAAKKACEDGTPVINGRRANCNLASLGARRAKSSPPPQAMAAAAAAPATAPATHPSPLPHQGSNVVGLRTIPTTAAANPQVQWYYPAPTTPLPYHQPHRQAIPFFGYSPTYIGAADIAYNQKMCYNGGGVGGGGYMNGHYCHHHHQVYPSQTMLHANTLVPMYPHHHHHHHHHHPPLFHHHHAYHQAHTTMGVPAHIFPTTTTSGGPISTVPAILSKPASIPPPPTNLVCLAVE
ncbi:hypothetical protein MLD38_024194 [Melastoma candidum]|uniref:Uncharacterized protein n=1 Tax=Melastoma candidum TaxID=119954 RepID=A0ACB9NSF9_9MYRT|nr:hypothetical protein MLD38_024194 [Melastoma candidum]